MMLVMSRKKRCDIGDVMRFPFRLESMRLCLCRTSRDLFLVCVRVCV